MSYSINAQDKLHKTIPELTMPNPETASLGKYGDIPMNYYTGTANIAVPLYTLNFDGLEIPINLSYNTGGIRTNQEATWVGLGWTLSCEPVITRQIKGICDITLGSVGGASKGYAYTNIRLPDYNVQTEEIIDRIGLYYYPYAHASGWDTEPDIFTANIFGESISFILTQKAFNNGVIGVKMINGDKGYRVEYIEEEKSFIIINNNGYRFYFSQEEYSITASRGSGSYDVTQPYTSPLITGWKLDKVVSPNEKSLNFSYISVVTQSQPIRSSMQNKLICDYRAPNFPNDKWTTSYYMNGFTIKYLKQISSDNINIEFVSSERLDMGSEKEYITNMSNYIGHSNERAQKLDNIIIKNSLNNVIHNLRFNYSYFNEDRINEKYPARYLRLKLDSIYDNNLLIRSFTYINPNRLTDKESLNSDFWGFYNGSINSKGHPSIYKEIPCSSNKKNYFYVEGGNRFPNIEFAKNGSLETIIYPTKGYTKLIYESNEMNLNNTNIGNFDIYNYPFSGKEIFLESNSEDYPKTSEIFEITEESELSTTIEITYGFGDGFTDEFASSHVKYTIDSRDADNISYQIINVDNNRIIDEGRYTDIANGPPINPELRKDWPKRTGKLKLAKGKYKLFVRGLKHISNFYDEEEYCYPGQTDYGKIYNFKIRVKVRIPMLSFRKNINTPVGGLRMKSMENYENNILQNKEEYKYTLGGDNEDISSGILLDELRFDNVKNYSHVWKDQQEVPHFVNCNVAEVYSNSISNSPSPNFIGYSRVEEIYIDRKNNGKKVMEFINEPNRYEVGMTTSGNVMLTCIAPLADFLVSICPEPGNHELAVIPSHSYQDINGKLLKETYYNDRNEKIRESLFTYDRENYSFSNFAHPQTISTGIAQYQSAHSGDGTSSIYALQIYRIISENISLISRTDIEYNNGIPITKTINYEYNNEFLPKKIKETTSQSGKDQEIEYKYPFDLVSIEQTANLQKLINENKISEPVIIKTKVGNNRLSESHIKYKEIPIEYSANNQALIKNIVVSDEIYQLIGSGNIDINLLNDELKKIKYDKYNNSGKLLQYTTLDGIITVLLWSYNGQYPIAEIKGATYDQIKGVLTESVIDRLSASIEPSESDLKKLNDLRSNVSLGNIMVTTYTHKPLVGMTSATDPSGKTTYYEYDSFNRLKRTYIKERSSNSIEVEQTLQSHDYHYSNQ
ncbi:hypothetical protein [Dysgonomonas sp. BGC7]|nr:hypothetical protein [Dysgonomonas sp. BGC7]